jgi:hypothetical protein
MDEIIIRGGKKIRWGQTKKCFFLEQELRLRCSCTRMKDGFCVFSIIKSLHNKLESFLFIALMKAQVLLVRLLTKRQNESEGEIEIVD